MNTALQLIDKEIKDLILKRNKILRDQFKTPLEKITGVTDMYFSDIYDLNILKSRSRRAEAVYYRNIIMYLMAENSEVSKKQSAAVVDRDRTVIYHALQTIKDQYTFNGPKGLPSYKKAITDILNILENNE